jgi:hypothetical protein
LWENHKSPWETEVANVILLNRDACNLLEVRYNAANYANSIQRSSVNRTNNSMFMRSVHPHFPFVRMVPQSSFQVNP